MLFHIDEVTSDVTVIEGEMPFSQAQIEKLVQLVLRRVAEKHREASLTQEACSIQRHVMPALRIGD
jgi:hypothetical protein